MESYWRKTEELKKREALSGDISCDAAVIGAGMAGLLTAFLLKEEGLNVAVLEADRICGGQTQNTTAKITSQHGLIYHGLIRNFGEEKAQIYAHANQDALWEYRRLSSQYDIDCQLRDVPAYLYTSSANTLPLMAEEKAARCLGLPAVYTTSTSLPFPVTGALRFDHQAMFHPLQFADSIAKKLTIYEHTPALSVDGCLIRTPGGRVKAKQIVLATHYPFIDSPGYFFLRMHQERSYVISLENAPTLDGMYLGIDSGGLSLRNSDGSLLLGGGSHRTGHNRQGGKYDQLRRQARRYFPGTSESSHWSAQDCMTLDGLPYIGRFSRRTPRMYVATGFGKWGMTGSMLSAMLIRDAVIGREHPCARLLSPQRLTLKASFRQFIHDGAVSAAELSKGLFFIPGKEAADLPRGSGDIVNAGGKKAAAYRDEEGSLHLSSPRCSHMGCQLSYNPDENIWECPCHGSRFDCQGNLIDNPAVKNLRSLHPPRS